MNKQTEKTYTPCASATYIFRGCVFGLVTITKKLAEGFGRINRRRASR